MNMELRAIIIDDEQNGIESLKLLIGKFTPDVRVVATTSESPEGIALIKDFQPDIVFLDINMPQMNGFEVLNRLEYRNFALIFTTAHAEHALKALKSNALDYLLKPIDTDDLQGAVKKVRSTKENTLPDLSNFYSELSRNNKIALNTRNKVEYVDKNDIIRLESSSNYTYVYTVSSGELVIGRTIKEFEDLLCRRSSTFMRVHQSHIVNLNHIVRFRKDCSGIITTRDLHSVPLSKHKREEFFRWLNIG
jgi:two-component system LytT family response regulator